MAVTSSPNMNLPIPGVGTEPGPTYAQDVNNCFGIVDSHTHVPGNGVPVTPDGLNISADLPFQGNNAIDLRSVRMQSQLAPLGGGADLGCIYNSGGNLYFNDGSGNQIAITSGGGVAGSPGSISGLTSPASASYTSGSKLFTWSSGASGKAAAMDNGAVTIRQTDTASAKGITISSPNSLGADYSLTLPSGLPAFTQYLSCDTSGNIATVTGDVIGQAMTSVGSNSISAARTRATGSTVAAGGVAQSALSSGTFTSTSSSFVDVTNLTVTITTSGRPVVITLIPDVLSGGSSVSANANASTDATAIFLFLRGTNPGPSFFGLGQIRQHINGAAGNQTLEVPPAALTIIDFPPAGTYIYKLQGAITIGTNFKVTACYMVAYEL